jgi:hypothetical protein
MAAGRTHSGGVSKLLSASRTNHGERLKLG